MMKVKKRLISEIRLEGRNKISKLNNREPIRKLSVMEASWVKQMMKVKKRLISCKGLICVPSHKMRVVLI